MPLGNLDLIWKRGLMIEESRWVIVHQFGIGAEAEAGADLGRVDVLGQQLDQRVAVLHHQVVALSLQVDRTTVTLDN